MIASFTVSAVFCWLIMLTRKIHDDFTANNLSGPQTIHEGKVPRIGGIGIMLALLIGALFSNAEISVLIWPLILSSLLVFIAGTIEDVTGKVSPNARLVAALLSGVIFVLITGVSITNVGVDWTDVLLKWTPLSFFVTILAIASLTNGINMIDGLNGLAIGVCSFASLAIAWLAYSHGDLPLAVLAMIFLSAIAGVGIFNFPFGKIFVGDGGAYLMGAVLSMLVILLSQRHGDISAFASLLIVIYPFYEMIRSMFRRLLLGKGAMLPDSKHLHSLIYNRNVQRNPNYRTLMNYMSALTMLILPAICCIWAVLFAKSVSLLLIGLILFVIGYELLFRFYRDEKNVIDNGKNGKNGKDD